MGSTIFVPNGHTETLKLKHTKPQTLFAFILKSLCFINTFLYINTFHWINVFLFFTTALLNLLAVLMLCVPPKHQDICSTLICSHIWCILVDV